MAHGYKLHLWYSDQTTSKGTDLVSTSKQMAETVGSSILRIFIYVVGPFALV